jgi:hypothetical protein
MVLTWHCLCHRRRKSSNRGVKKRPVLFEAHSDWSGNDAYAKRKHQYLIDQISELKRKSRLVAIMLDQHMGSVADAVEREKRTMASQRLKLEREEVRVEIWASEVVLA